MRRRRLVFVRTSALLSVVVSVSSASVLGSVLGCRETPPTARPDPAPSTPAPAPAPHPALLDPSLAREQAPERFLASFSTSKGEFVIEVRREWAPRGADRFHQLVEIGFFDGVRFFRAIEGFMVQLGIHGDPSVSRAWASARIEDDPVSLSNTRGTVSFATAGPNTRTTQVFVNYTDANAKLDARGFAPFGRVVSGMEVVDALYKGYGEGAPMGSGPSQPRLQAEGNAYLEREFPKLDWVKQARIVPAP